MDMNNNEGYQPYNPGNNTNTTNTTYTTGVPQYTSMQPEKKWLSVGEWMLTLFLLALPCVGIVMLFVWGFGDDDERKNFSRAYLIWIAIGIAIMVFFYILLIMLGVSIINLYR